MLDTVLALVKESAFTSPDLITMNLSLVRIRSDGCKVLSPDLPHFENRVENTIRELKSRMEDLLVDKNGCCSFSLSVMLTIVQELSRTVNALQSVRLGALSDSESDSGLGIDDTESSDGESKSGETVIVG